MTKVTKGVSHAMVGQSENSSTVTFIDASTLKTVIAGPEEFSLIDPREEGVFGKAHLLLAVNVPLSRLELRVGQLVPRKGSVTF
jgi:rhodanese-related sulfurtransferase